MADSLKDLLFKKADDMDFQETRDDLHIIQTELDRLFPKSIKILSLNEGKLHVTTRSSSIASDLRLQNIALTQNLNMSLKTKLVSMRRSIR